MYNELVILSFTCESSDSIASVMTGKRESYFTNNKISMIDETTTEGGEEVKEEATEEVVEEATEEKGDD